MADSPPNVHVVLYQPEIPQNTGNIGRTCVALRAKLWIVRPAGFQLDDAKIRRSGLDYWQHLDIELVNDWQELTDRLAGKRFFFLSRFARRTIWDVEFQPEDVLVFGRESAGLPDDMMNPDDPGSLRIPMGDKVRCLNLATSAGIVLYEHERQTNGLNL